MRKLIQNLLSRFKKQKTAKPSRKRKGQSLVEFAIALPILFWLLSGVVEFGFALNYYLSLLDATREASRYYAGADPFLRDSNGDRTGDNIDFFSDVSDLARANLDPRILTPSFQGRIIELDPALDDVIVTVYAKDDSGVVSYPTAGSYQVYNNATSLFSSGEIASKFESGSPNAGILVVEVHYNYHMVLALPWITAFVPNPMPLRAYTIMPLAAAEPVEIGP